MPRRCVVQGCTSLGEEKQFHATISQHGQAFCPRHTCHSDKCGCSKETKLFSHYGFPKSPGLRRVWNSLLQLPEDYLPKDGYVSVCSKHFDLSSSGRAAPNRKLPILHIGRSDSEIQRILNSHVSSVIEKQTVLGFSSHANKMVNDRLADTTTAAIALLETTEKHLQVDTNVIDENVDLEGVLAPMFSTGEHEILRIESGAKSTTLPPHSTAATISKDAAMDDRNSETVVLARRALKPIARGSAPETSRLRPVSMAVDGILRTPPLSGRRRPFSWAHESPFKTPPHSGKHPCEQETPDYSTTIPSQEGIIASTSLLHTEVCVLRHQLDKTRTRLFSVESSECSACVAYLKKLASAERKIDQMELKIKVLQEKPPRPSPVLHTRTEIDLDVGKMPEKRFMAIFGLRKKTFSIIFDKLEPVARSVPYWEGTARTTAKQKSTPTCRKPRNVYLNEFLLFLMRLRLKVNEELLALIFGWSIGRISMVVNTWLNIFSRQLTWIIKMPDPVACRRILPAHVAAAFPRLRCIIDCTELFIQSPQSTADQVATYSQYKKHNTLKVLVAVLGNGFISFVSAAWGGRTSDNYIFKHCGLLEMLQSGDQILADRGFSISDELIRRGVQINIPPAATGVSQFPTEAVANTQRIANVRIHVERAIGRMKSYHILNGVLPLTMVPVVDKVFKSVAILVNLQDELVKT